MAAINSNFVSRQDIKEAIERAVELRAIHSALMQGASPTHHNLLSSSSVTPHLSAHDYPIFTPSYEDEPVSVSGYHQLQLESRALSEAWEDQCGQNGVGTMQSDHITENGSSTKNLVLALVNSTDHDTRSFTSSCTNHITEIQKSRRSSLGDTKSVSSCNNHYSTRNGVNDSDSIASSSNHCKQQPKGKGVMFSWLLPRSKKKPKDESMLSIETLKKELLEANRKRDEALDELTEMKSSFGDLRKKLENLEGYCDELKKALRETEQPNGSQQPVNEEVMVEGFLQMVSETRVSVKRFCKTLVRQIEETDHQLTDSLSINAKSSKVVLYHLEAIINRELYENFENCVFQKNGTPKVLDPQEDRQAKFSSFVALRNLSWNEVIRKGTKYYSEDLSKFCDKKMSCIISELNWIRPWPEQLLESFFVAAKCIWLLHLLSFSFYPPINILRVEENRQFDPHYMEDIPTDGQRTQQGSSRVKTMVMPGFYVQDKILKCKVLCRYKSVT